MSKRIHFVSGLPRACSTLLCNILAQNPRIHATATSPLHEFGYMARQVFETQEASSMNKEAVLEPMFFDYVRAGCENAFNSLTERPVVCDKGRSWVGHLDQLFKVMPEAKVLVPVRDVRAILSSMEKKYRTHPEVFSGLEKKDPTQWTTTEKRAAGWLSSPPVGIALERVYEAKQRFFHKIMFVHAEDLTNEPTETMADIWKYLGEEPFEHDFDNIEQYTEENDVGFPYGDHIIRPKVEPLVKDWQQVLGRKLSEAISQKFNWIKEL